jgi:hypothetical protein
MGEWRIVAVDWSGAKSGAARKIAMAEARDGVLVGVDDRLTREDVVAQLVAYASDGGVIAGLDFGFSLPAWYLRERAFARAHDCWRWLAADGCADDLLRACGDPFWGRKGRPKPALAAHFRRTETVLRDKKLGPKSVFQIAGAGAVGTGSIRGMGALHRLSEAGFSVWPFDDAARSVAIEIYPRLLYTRAVVKSSADDRAAYVRNEVGVPGALRDAVAKTEDTFDAAIAAIAMSRHAAELRALPSIDDPVLRVEGIIWWPEWPASHGC